MASEKLLNYVVQTLCCSFTDIAGGIAKSFPNSWDDIVDIVIDLYPASRGHDLAEGDGDALPRVSFRRIQPILQYRYDLGQDAFAKFPHKVSESACGHSASVVARTGHITNDHGHHNWKDF